MQINIIWILSSRCRVFWKLSLVLFLHVCLSNVNTSFSGAHWPSWTNRSSRTQGRSWRTGKHSLNWDWDALWHQFDSFKDVQGTTVPWFSSERTNADSHMFDLVFFLCVRIYWMVPISVFVNDSSQWNMLKDTDTLTDVLLFLACHWFLWLCFPNMIDAHLQMQTPIAYKRHHFQSLNSRLVSMYISVQFSLNKPGFYRILRDLALISRDEE